MVEAQPGRLELSQRDVVVEANRIVNDLTAVISSRPECAQVVADFARGVTGEFLIHIGWSGDIPTLVVLRGRRTEEYTSISWTRRSYPLGGL